jgi:acetylornithine deacetylase/succinyl-diaminopimelate desuccinylase-like protein
LENIIRRALTASFIFIVYGSLFAAEPDWGAAQEDLIQLLQDLIRCNTVNPPGNEIAACRVLKNFFDHEGIESHIYKSEKDRANLLARLKGIGVQKPILLVAHTDVVPFEEDEWSAESLSGEVKDGYLYGRGALDDKGMLAVEAMTLALLKRGGIALQRDILVLATADEEAGGEAGVGWMLENHPNEVEAAFALNEGGRIILRDGEPLYIGIQTSEKAAFNIRLVAYGTSGHAAVPRLDNPIYALAQALGRIESLSDQQKFTPVTRAFFEGISPFEPTLQWQGDRIITNDALYLALLTNTISPTMLSAGIKTNVIPAGAEANLNCRLLPGQDIEPFAAELREAIGSGPYELKYTPRTAPPQPSSRDGVGFILIEQVCRELFPDTPIVPYLSPGMSDGTRLRRAGIPTYGLLPFPLDENETGRLHGKDERVSIEALMTGLKLVYRLAELAGK